MAPHRSPNLLVQKIIFVYKLSLTVLNLRKTMSLVISPEIGVPYSKEVPYMDLKERIEAACNTALQLAEHGLDMPMTTEDETAAAAITTAYADSPESTSKAVTTKRVAKMTPASLVLTNNILQEFGQSVAENATQIRHLVTNKLLLESENPDAKIRIRALELLGKISDVGLFAEKSEVTVTHQSTDDLRANLRSKLEKLVNPPLEIENAVFEEEDAVDLDEELGLKPVEPYDDDA